MTNDTELDTLETVLRHGWEIGNPITQIDMEFLASAADAITTLRAQLAEARAEVAFMQACGVIELMTRNPNINSYVIEWEGRTIRAEAERDAAQAALAAQIDAAAGIAEAQEALAAKRANDDDADARSDWDDGLIFGTQVGARLISATIRAQPHDRTALDRIRRAERDKALRDAAFVAANACLVEPDGGNPTEEERLVCDEARRRIIAMIEQPEIGSGGKP